MKLMISFLTLCSVMLVSGCVSDMPKQDPNFAAVRPVAIPKEQKHDGAIFDARDNVSLFEDYRAHRVGDILTVRLEEKTDAQKKTKTTIKKDNSNTLTNPTVFGTTPQFNLPNQLPLASTTNNNLGFDLQSSHNFKGQGDSNQSNQLTGDITVSVAEVLPNGNLVIRGEKVVSINQGNEYVKLSGIISPRDLDSDNSISSTRVADAQISYVGDGETNDANVMGWLSRFFLSALSPF